MVQSCPPSPSTPSPHHTHPLHATHTHTHTHLAVWGSSRCPRKSHQFFVIAKGRVATRQHSCWCLACHTRINKGGAKFSGGDANGCEHAQGGIYKWTDESCAQKGGSAIQTAWKRAKVKRAQAAMSLTMGTWCLLLAPDDDEEEFWLAQTVPVDAWNGACSKKHSTLTMVNGRRFDVGDVEIAVQYYGPSCRA